ncbi:uncharacterized protein TNCV_3053541 [Trichonephila clavipes]|uniref:Uncharacterized protein n=1 Tax=Trichonephila clavipes TaxID=2585209 RepID=A0A8X6RV52_TRICX|nr:uncharacterized protein TNCV_3053541 [Trichonephila clavipes]
MIADPANCEIRPVIRFLNARNFKAVEINCQLVEIYSENVKSGGMMRKWNRQFNYGHTNAHDEAWSRQLSVVNDGLVNKGNEKIHENRQLVHNKIALQ